MDMITLSLLALIQAKLGVIQEQVNALELVKRAEASTIESQIPLGHPIIAPKMPVVASLVASSTKVSNKEKALVLVEKYAKQFNVNKKDMIDVMTCENRDFDPKLQSYYIQKDGTRERSYGVAQWNLDYNDITYEQATDMEWSIREMARAFSVGNQNLWSCWKIVRPLGVNTNLGVDT